jgi:hypothetical protein
MGLRDGWSSSRNRLLTLVSAAVAASIALGGASAAGAAAPANPLDGLVGAVVAPIVPSLTIETLSGPGTGRIQRLSALSGATAALAPGARYRVTGRALGSTSVREVVVPAPRAATAGAPSTAPDVQTVPPPYDQFSYQPAHALALGPLWLTAFLPGRPSTFPAYDAWVSSASHGLAVRPQGEGWYPPSYPLTSPGRPSVAAVEVVRRPAGIFLDEFRFVSADGVPGPSTYRLIWQIFPGGTGR